MDFGTSNPCTPSSCEPGNSNNSPSITSPTCSPTTCFALKPNSSTAAPPKPKPSIPVSNSYLIEFTKRKNWSHRIIDQLPDFYYVINPAGCFMYCSPSSMALVGYSPTELIGRNIVDFIHVDDVDIFIRDIKQSLEEHQFKLFYRFRKKDDRFVMLEAQGHAYRKGNPEAKCFFSIARPYPLKATSNMDKLLELKLENEILRQRLARLRGGYYDDSASPQSSVNQDLDETLLEESTYNDEDLRNSLDLRGGRVDRGASSSTSTSNSNSTSCIYPIPNKEETPTQSQTQSNSALGANKKKRKHKIEDDVDRGPHGPKTLCNACGLRWAKKSRRESKTEGAASES
ncbi:hypothetical protein K493DRAFT_317922 [Basidiobolus meristosporus CBS 931.73]|uniref:PAS domain-containing protein n=1 Tax=Basidiobolus meristosporus CBS 931.73 TaxID=1314790 RepID=A0A1Y1XXL9_9FUNG|nr:hypothetical protein K493DRAFT_317922 [Basidiobolus meristosporus CBS 931.73]|eukprot:ORX90491.1 hypothetical protein K493DRAFT_317922 [Basidiobolus meristosporus CBS 931.73]